jgi:hypothetical protein
MYMGYAINYKHVVTAYMHRTFIYVNTTTTNNNNGKFALK